MLSQYKTGGESRHIEVFIIWPVPFFALDDDYANTQGKLLPKRGGSIDLALL